MVRFGSLLLFLVLIVLANQSCKKSEDNCAFLPPDMIFVNFTEDESDTMIIRRYVKGTNFSQLQDTMRISRAHIIRTEVGKDSLKLVPDNYPLLASDFYLYDWQIHFPKASRTVYISEVVPQFTQQAEKGARCQSYVQSLMFDRRPYQFSSWFDTPYRVYANR